MNVRNSISKIMNVLDNPEAAPYSITKQNPKTGKDEEITIIPCIAVHT
ncbi:hypothetical protein [Methanobrevibacter sp.]